MNKICYIVTMASTIRAFFVSQLNYLSKNGFEVTVICSADELLQKELNEDIKYIELDIPRGIAFWKSVSIILQLTKIMNKEKYNIVQYSTPNAGFYASIAAKMAKIKIRNYHLMGYRYQGAKGLFKVLLKMIEKITCILSTHIECVSKSNMEFGIVERLFSPEKVCVVGNGSTGGVDFTKFDITKRDCWRKQVRQELGYSDEDFIFGYFGRLNEDKGILELIKAHNSLNDKSKLLLIGEIEDSIIKETLQTDALYRIRTCKWVDDIERYFAGIDVFVLPSHREGFGNVIIEAEAMGTPVIVSDIPGPIDAMKEGETGLVFNVKNIESLKLVMKNVQNDYQKYSQRNCYEFAKVNFDSNEINRLVLKRKKWLLESLEEYV